MTIQNRIIDLNKRLWALDRNKACAVAIIDSREDDGKVIYEVVRNGRPEVVDQAGFEEFKRRHEETSDAPLYILNMKRYRSKINNLPKTIH